ncbi:hypothetical protein ACET3X_001577 [Alternaria dauci]|uniref:Mitochondrial carrier protein n=1 Tax=Alternaria dauci TaxID=48095 RepID=A0ABR3UY81_9PLEO
MFRIQPVRAVQRASFVRPAVARPRFLSTTPARFAQKDAQDKDSLKPRSTEYSKSGSDDGAAHSDAAFDPSKTSPEEAEATAGREAGGPENSLNVSPGNKDVSDPNSPDVGGNGGAPDKKSTTRSLRTPVLSTRIAFTARRTFLSTPTLRIKEDAQRSPEELENAKQEQLKEQERGEGRWREDLASHGESNIAADKQQVDDHDAHIKELQKEGKEKGEKGEM